MRKIITPTKETPPIQSKCTIPQQQQTPIINTEHIDLSNNTLDDETLDDNTINSSIRPLFGNDNDKTSINPIASIDKSPKLSWDTDPKRVASENASMAPLISLDNSSIRSSTFSDTHSAQSTKATVFSSRTMDTNSSTMAIPPASILNRSRQHSSTTATNASLFSHTTSSHLSRPDSIKQVYQQKNNSSNTVDSVVTIKS